MKKLLTIAASALIVAGIAVGGTLAWLTSQTEVKTNTFTFGKVDIALAEYDTYGPEGSTPYTDGKLVVPGGTIAKIPVITVKADSEETYVYAKINNGFGDLATIPVNSNWTLLSDGVYRYNTTVAKTDADQALVLFEAVQFSDTITHATITGWGANIPTITIQSYAHQAANTTQAAADTAALAALNPAP